MPANKKRTKKTIGLKMTALFVLFALLFCLALSIFAYRASWDAYTDIFAVNALEVAKMTASVVDGDRIAGYLDTMETDEYYDELQEQLNNIKRELNLMYLYIFKPGDETHFTFIMEAKLDTDNAEMINYLGDVYETYIEYDFFMQDNDLSLSNGSVRKVILYDEYYGHSVWAYAPIYSGDGEITAMAGADISLKAVEERQAAFFKTIIILSCSVTILLVVGMMFVTRRIISKPLKKLTTGVLNFASDGQLSSFDCNINTGDEMQMLSEAFGKMAQDINLYINNLAAVTADRERIATELDVATRIQSSLLPCIFPAFPEREEFDIHASMFPAKEVGGDFYDFFLIDENTLAVVIADVSGKGVPAALFMVIAKTLIKNNAQSGKSPKEAFETVNNTLFENNDERMFVTAFMGYLDLQSGKFTYVNAGHNPPLIKKAGGKYEFFKTKPSIILACYQGKEYKEYQTELSKGDILYLYTDGVTEAMNIEEDFFTTRRLSETADKCTDCSVKELLETVKHEIDIFADGAEQADDITMLALLYKGGHL